LEKNVKSIHERVSQITNGESAGDFRQKRALQSHAGESAYSGSPTNGERRTQIERWGRESEEPEKDPNKRNVLLSTGAVARVEKKKPIRWAGNAIPGPRFTDAKEPTNSIKSKKKREKGGFSPRAHCERCDMEGPHEGEESKQLVSAQRSQRNEISRSPWVLLNQKNQIICTPCRDCHCPINQKGGGLVGGDFQKNQGMGVKVGLNGAKGPSGQ